MDHRHDAECSDSRPEDVVDEQVDQLDPDEREDHPAHPVDEQVPPQQCRGADRRYFTPLSASGTSAGMISALKMIAEMIALFGCRDA